MYRDHGDMDIRTLARHLGLSIGTVSRALNDRKDVSPETRKRVIAAAATHGYIPNQSGRTLRSGRTGTIGFMLTLEHDSAIHGDPFFMALLEGLQNGLSEHDLDLVVLLARKGEDGLTFLRRHVARGTVDGWVLSGTHRADPRIDFLLDRAIPFVALGRTATARDYAWIDLDFEGVVTQAMALLTDAGHHRIGLVAPPVTINNSHIVVERYRTALARAGSYRSPWIDAFEVRAASVAEVRSLGIAGERAVGDIGQKVRLSVPGTDRYRVVDGYLRQTNTISEVKNVKSLSYTQQLRDNVTIARSQGARFDLYVRNDTILTGPLNSAILRGDIVRRTIPGSR